MDREVADQEKRHIQARLKQANDNLEKDYVDFFGERRERCTTKDHSVPGTVNLVKVEGIMKKGYRIILKNKPQAVSR